MKKIVSTVVMAAVMAVLITSAQAAIQIQIAKQVRRGLALIKGKGATAGAQIAWEGGLVTTANNTATLEEHLPVDDRIWSVISPVLMDDPPDNGVTGVIQARVALEAMIAHSDNTATDMALKRVGADNVRAFIASIGLVNSRIPDSTRQFFGYMARSPNWQHLTWRELIDALVNQPPTGPPLINDVVTFVSTANDFVSFYSRALQGEFFQQEASLRTFRHILTMEVGSEVFPLGLTGFSKGGTFQFRQEHALALAGGVFIPQGRWAYFSVMCNWVNGEGGSTAEELDAFIRILHNIFSGLQDEFST